MMKKKFCIILTTIVNLAAHADTSPVKDVSFGGFIDTYYAYDFNAPADHEREFTTQPVRHNEFNINLAYIEAILKREKTRGRLALQYGHSVTKNTATTEPTDGKTSGALDSKTFQEAYVGTKIAERTWIDMGIFLGNIGAESWISKDNWTYTRALMLDYVPYYSAGVRLDHQFDGKQSGQLQLLNGWQNMSENNQSKAIGMQYKNLVSDKFTFTYNNFFGDEEIVGISSKPRFRQYHDFIFQWFASEAWQFLYAFDVGTQSQKVNHGTDAWFATAFTIHRIFNPIQSVSLRLEYYNDPHECNVTTGTLHGFRTAGASMNYDQKLDEKALWRTEIKGHHSRDKIYPEGRKYKNDLDGFIVTSLSLWF